MAEVGPVAPLVQSWLSASDPGLVRLTLAVRGTLSVFLTPLAAMWSAMSAAVQPVEFASGVTLSMMAPFLMREPTPRQRQLTLLMLVFRPPCGHGRHRPAARPRHRRRRLLPGLVFVCFLLHPRSPRMVGLGLVAVVTTYVGLYLELPPRPCRCSSSRLSPRCRSSPSPVSSLVPMDPAATLRRIVEAVQGRAGQVLRSARIGSGASLRRSVGARDLCAAERSRAGGRRPASRCCEPGGRLRSARG